MGHLAHACDFYVMIVAEAQFQRFTTVGLHTGLSGWQTMAMTDTRVARCGTTSAILECLEAADLTLRTLLEGLTPAELDRPFVLSGRQPEAEPMTTTLRQRVVQMAADHIREHLDHLTGTLAAWQKAEEAR